MHYLFCVLFLLMGTTIASAELPDRGEITRLIQSGQNLQARRAVEAWVAKYDSGRATADEVRDVFIGLSRSHPKIQKFNQSWMSEDRGNPLPQIARAWALWNSSGTLGRGGSDRSVSLAWELYYEARDLAAHAYLTKPDLVPASDAVIRGLTDGLELFSKHDEVQRILRKDPNWGSLVRYVGSFANQKMAYSDFANICSELSVLFPVDLHQITYHRCVMSAGVDWNFAWLNEYGKAFFRSDTSADMAITYAYTFATKSDLENAAPADVLWAHNVVLNADFDQFSLFQLRAVATKLAQAPIAQELNLNTYQEFLTQHLDRARYLLEADPFNDALLNFVDEATDLTWSQHFAQACGREVGQQGCVLSYEEQERFYAKRRQNRGDLLVARLKANPWAPERWSSLSEHLYSGRMALFEGDLALENAAALSDDPLAYVTQILTRKVVQLSALQDIEFNLDTALSEYVDQFQSIDVIDQVYCPFLRAYRYRTLICQMSDKKGCSAFDAEDEAMIATWDILQTLAEKETACQSVLVSSAAELGYSVRAYKDVFPD